MAALAQRFPALSIPPLGDVVEGFRRHELLVRASGIAFRTLFALIPLTRFALAAAGACVLAAAAFLQLAPLPGILRYVLAAAALWLTVGLLVRFGPAEPQPLGWISFGSTLVVVGWLVTWTIYGLYLTHIADVGSAFGAFAAVIVLMTFLQLSASVLLAGALIDALVRKAVTGDRQGT